MIRVALLGPPLLLLIAALFQVTVLADLRPMGLVPDLVLVVVIVTTLVRGAGWGGGLGMAAGLILDVLSGELIGLGAATKMLTGILVGKAFRGLFPENYIVPALAVFSATLVDQTLYGLGARTFGVPIQLLAAMWEVVLPLAILNSLIALPLYPYVLRRISDAAEARRRRAGRAAWRVERRAVNGSR